jgi:hypothetical protein
MKRILPNVYEDLPRKRQNTAAVNPFGSYYMKADIKKADIKNAVDASSQPDLPRIPHEVVFNHIVPNYALTWLFVSKKCHKIAFAALPADPRLEAKFSNAKDTFCQACKEGNARVVHLMLKDPRVVPKEFRTSLPTVFDYNVAKLFIECNKTAFLLREVYFWAVHQGYLDMIAQLLTSSGLDHDGDNLVSDAIAVAKHDYVVKYLFSFINTYELVSPLTIEMVMQNTITSGNYSVFSELIKHIDPSWRHSFALRFASLKGRYEIVKLLLKHPQVDPNDRRECVFDDVGDNEYFLSSAIEEALLHRHSAIITLLMNDPRVKVDDVTQQKFAHLLP